MKPLPIRYSLEPDLAPEEFVAVLETSGLAERRPVQERSRIERMLGEASLILTARVDDRLIGVARGLTDHAFCFYLSDLAVDRSWQGSGVGRELIRRSHADAGGEQVTLILLSAPDAESYYPHIGLQQFPQCFVVNRKR